MTPTPNNNGIEDGQDDANNDGIQDGQEQSGTIVSFDSGVLTVSLVNGDTLKGAVDSGTEIECDNPAQTTTTASTRDDGGDSNSGDQTESGDDNQTSSTPPSTSGDDENQGDDDQGDNNDDQGDDNQGDNSSCGTDALTAGTIVKEAELHLTSAGAVFDKIDLGGKAPA